jgi:yecA family protein
MSYTIIDAILVQYDGELSAAEAHGMASGLLAVNSKFSNESWLHELLQNTQPISEEHKVELLGLFDDTQDVLLDDEFEFELFLPEDDESDLVERVDALRQWCKGFLFGVGFANTSTKFSQQTQEILKDVAEITKLDTDIELDDEEAENDFMELTEYLRAAVLALRDELNFN